MRLCIQTDFTIACFPSYPYKLYTGTHIMNMNLLIKNIHVMF